jgi:UPF0755 protein
LTDYRSGPPGDWHGEPAGRPGPDRDLLPPAYQGHAYDPEEPDDGYASSWNHHEEWPVVADAPTPRRRTQPPRRRRIKHPILTTLGVIVVLLVLLAGIGIWWANSQISPGGRPGPDVSVSIPSGSSTSKIGKILASAGVIHNGTLFAYYVKLHGDGPLFPGHYSLPKNSSYASAIAALEKGPTLISDTLVIPEGYTVRQIAARVGALPNLGLSAQKFIAAATDGTVRSPYEPPNVDNLEGLLFPATYQVHQGETEVDILEQMVGEFDTQADSIGLQAAAQRLGYTPYQIVTVASIIEKEAKITSDRGPVASVIYNRLKAGTPLGADSTQTYYLRLSDPSLGVPTVAQDDQPSPYNTRLSKGLPPTPISNPGIPSLEAAANPPATSYLYFVEVNPDGQLGFASSTTGFDHLQAECRAAGLC